MHIGRAHYRGTWSKKALSRLCIDLHAHCPKRCGLAAYGYSSFSVALLEKTVSDFETPFEFKFQTDL